MIRSGASTRWLLGIVAWFLATAIGRSQETAPFPRAGDHATVAECAECHGKQQRLLARSHHQAILSTAALPGCETCHGPGRRHADRGEQDLASITLPTKLSATAQEALCARCHAAELPLHGGDLPGLRQAGKTCTDCHEVHAVATPSAPAAPPAHRDVAAAAQPIGSARCVDCHPVRDDLLRRSAHASLAAGVRDDGCEGCHGPGSRHAAADGRGGIARPDRAADGAATCRSCHQEVDEQAFHWRDRPAPFLAAGVTCATCHRVHVPQHPQTVPLLAEPGRRAATNRTCAACHLPALCTMPGSTHATLGGADLPLADGCGSCHPGGEAHAERGGRRELVERLGGAAAAVQARICLPCHRASESVRGHERGDHHRHGVGCVDCHGPLHGAQPTAVVTSAAASCRRCHADVAAEFAQPNHHPVPEGRMHCSSCHDVHGGRARSVDRELSERSCIACHPRQGGPFVFAHQAGRRDGCVACHVPHGSATRRLLAVANSQQNCLSCHGDFPVFHDQTQGAVFTDCMRCHTEVHGSNHSRFLFR